MTKSTISFSILAINSFIKPQLQLIAVSKLAYEKLEACQNSWLAERGHDFRC